MTALLAVKDLSVNAGQEVLVDKLSLILHKGESLTILGETGAGKSILMQTVMGLLPPGLRQTGGICIDGQDLASMPRQELEQLWGRRISMLPQEPWHSLDPLMRSERQLSEVYQYVRGRSHEAASEHAAADLSGVGLENDGYKLPSQLSGGMAQRLTFCVATAAGAELVLVDEPTKGLDASRRDYIATLLRTRAISQSAVLTITHDVEVARQLGGRIMVMRQGRIVEEGTAEEVLSSPRHSYTRELIAAAPRNWPAIKTRPAVANEVPALEAHGLSKTRGGKELFQGLDLAVGQGEIVGITGDSGCGKSSLGDILLGLLPADSGQVRRMAGIAPHRFLKLYQDPPAAFAPKVSLGKLFQDVTRLHRVDPQRLPPLLEQLGLSPSLLERSVDEVSGGELQRLAIARALLLDPVFLFADEPASRLDPITARGIITLLGRVAAEHNCAVLLVSHDPVLVERVCHRSLQLDGQQDRSAYTGTLSSLQQASSPS